MSFSMIVTGTGRAPALSSLAMRMTSSSEKRPVISPSEAITPWIVGAETYFLSRKMPSCLPMLSWVSLANLPGFLVWKLIFGLPDWSKAAWAPLRSAPE